MVTLTGGGVVTELGEVGHTNWGRCGHRTGGGVVTERCGSHANVILQR